VGYVEHVPAPALRSLVACTWAFSAPGHVHRVLPDGCIDIVIIDGRARVVGTMQRAIVVPASKSAVLGIRMRPGEAARLFPAAPRELTDSEATLDELWGDDGRMLEDALVTLVERATRSKLVGGEILRRAKCTVEDTLVRRLASHGEAIDARVRAASSLLAQGSAVREVAERVEISERQLDRRFTQRVGINPKAFARVRRLQRAALLLANGAGLSKTATLAGYADQAHFTREASALAGVTPSALARELSDGFDTAIPVAL
jgi:AraC-like DNA-binding protein